MASQLCSDDTRTMTGSATRLHLPCAQAKTNALACMVGWIVKQPIHICSLAQVFFGCSMQHASSESPSVCLPKHERHCEWHMHNKHHCADIIITANMAGACSLLNYQMYKLCTSELSSYLPGPCLLTRNSKFQK